MTSEDIGTRKELKGSSLFRTILMSFSLVAILSCMAIGLLTYYLRASGIRDEQYRLLETLRDEKQSSLSAWFDERAGDVILMASRPDIIEYCKVKEDVDVNNKAAMSALMALQQAYRYEAVFLADSKGRILFSTEVEVYSLGSLPKREATLQRAIRDKTNIISDVLISRVHSKPTLFFFSPIFDPGTAELIGILGILMDPAVWLYPQFTRSKYLGKTGEMLLVNQEGLAQSPLKYHEGAISSMILHAEPARRGAEGEFGIVAIEDYRNVPVMAAFGHIKEFNWGIVVKQDMSEINAPVRSMALSVVSVSLGVLLFALISGFFIAKRISQPALKIAHAAGLIGEGDLKVQAPIEGPLEVRQIAVNLNTMVQRLGLQVIVTQGISSIVAVTGKHNNILELLEEVLPMLMQATRSQLGVVYLAGTTENMLDHVLVYGLDTERITKQLVISPSDHLLTQNLSSGTVQVLRDLPESNELRINTQAGETAPRALLSVPLFHRGTVVGVVGLASLYDYDDAAQQIVDGIRANLAQAIKLCKSFERSKRMGSELDERNQELTATNQELTATSEEHRRQADELRSLADELEAQREQVTRADRLKSEFLSNMSHELRTPLNSVLSLTQLMLSNGIGAAGGEDKERLEIIERNGRHLLNLINDILDLSKIESGKMELYVSSFEALETVNAAVVAVRPMAEEKGLALTVEVAEMDQLQSDKGKLQQVLLNLLSNAQKFTEKGEICVNAQQTGDSVVFRIRDTGQGIPADVLPYIFDEFRQVDGSTTRKHGGTGLGLAICQRLVSLLGGRIDVESKVRKGTSFTVTIPMVLEPQNYNLQDDLKAASLPAQKRQPGSGPPFILVVEDDDVAAEQVAALLESDGFVVDVARDGEMALASVKKHIPDGIVLDLMMPNIDGFQVLNNIRSTAETERLPVLIMTAKDLTAKERLALEGGNVNQLIQKGQLNREALLESVRLLVGIQPDALPEVMPETRPRPRVTRRKGYKVAILVVEDNPDNMLVTKGILAGLDVDILEALDGREAVKTAKAKRPDIILMDINLPGVSGLEATGEIRQDRDLQNIVIIALTAKAMMGDREEILAAGCDDYLSKPVNPTTLKSTIQRWIEGDTA
jgi:signal transduction histidine kinase/DNA-binding response OmpR family regulator